MSKRIALVTSAVVSIPERSRNADRIDELMWHSNTIVPNIIVEDTKRIGCDENHLRAWNLLSKHDAKWSLVLEDDALPVDDFTAQLAAALTFAPAPIVSLYLGRSRPGFMQERIAHALVGCSHPGVDDPVDLDVPWLISNRLLHCVGVAIRSDTVRHMLPHLPTLIERTHAIDQAITEYARMQSVPIAYTVPSLVDHADGLSYAAHADQNPVHEPRVAWAAGKRSDWTSEFKIM